MSTLQSPKSHLPFLDWLRGVAILMVYACHSLDYVFDLDASRWQGLWPNWQLPWLVKWLYPLQFGHLGVAVFFVVSGLCIQLSWRGSWAQFWLKRFFRIYPPYLVALCVFAFVPPFAVWPIDWAEWMAHTLLVHNLKPEWAWGINSSFWSIAVEWQLYLAFPVLLLIRKYLGWHWTLPLLTLIEAGLRLWQGAADVGAQTRPLFILTMLPVGFWASWAMGAWLADIWRQRRSTVFNQPILGRWLVVGSAVATVGCLFTRLTHPLAFTLAALTTTAWIARKLGQLPHQQQRLPGFYGLSSIGLISYSLYLWHQPVLLQGLPWLCRTLDWTPLLTSLPFKAALALLCLPVCLGLAHLSMQWLEKPSMALGKRMTDQFFRTTAKSPLVWLTFAKGSAKPNLTKGL